MKKGASVVVLRICLVFLGLSTMIFLSGCGSGKPDATWNIAGGWYLYHDTAGTSGEQGPDLFSFSQSDNDLSGTTGQGESFTGSITGTDVKFSWTASDQTSYTYTGTVGSGIMAGTWDSSNGQAGTWRAVVNLAPVVNVEGSWNVFPTVTGSTEQGPEVFSFLQSGNSISGTASGGETITGNIGSLYIIFTWTSEGGTTHICTGTVSADSSTMSGTWTSPGGQSGSWRATKNG